jgi:hypothetical protein
VSQYLIRRVLQAIPLLLATSVIIFFLVRLAPGGPLAAAERNPNVSPEQLAILRHKYGLDQLGLAESAHPFENRVQGPPAVVGSEPDRFAVTLRMVAGAHRSRPLPPSRLCE